MKIQSRARINLRLLFVLGALFSGCASAPSNGRQNAGILAYACVDHSARYLLAFDPQSKRRGWGHLGGQPKQGESLAQTALREFDEESNCAFPPQILAGFALRGPSRQGHFNSFVAEVPFVNAEAIAMPRSCEDVERNQWVWVDHDALIGALQAPQDEPLLSVREGRPERIHLWAASARALRRALRDGLVSASDPCAE